MPLRDMPASPQTASIAARAAGRLLSAFESGNPDTLESELHWAALLCRERSRDVTENLDLLAALVEDIRRAEAARKVHAELLRHLARQS